MRLLFAGTPEVAVPVAGGAARLAPRGRRRAHPARRPAGRGRSAHPSPVAQLAEQARVEVLTPARPRDPEFLARLRELAPDCVPGRRLRRADPAGGAGRPARTAGSTCTSRCCPPGAARRRCSTRCWPATRSPAPARSSSRRAWTPGRCSASLTEHDPADATPAATCSTGSPMPAPGCSSPPSTAIEDGALRRGAAARRRRHRSAPKLTVDDAGSTGPRRRCASTGWSGRARPRRAPGRRSAASGSSSARSARPADDRRWRPGELRVDRSAVLVGTGDARRSSSARCSPQGKRADGRRRTGRAALRLEPGERLAVMPTAERRRAGAAGATRRPTGRRPPTAGRYDVLRAVGERDAYANLVLPGLLARARHRPAATRPSPPSSPTARCAVGAPTTRSSAACVDRPLDAGRPAGARRAAPRRPPAARHPGARRTPPCRRHGRPGPRAVGDGRGRFVNAVLRKVARPGR